MTCPVAWCDLQHAGPLPTQLWQTHTGVVEEMTLIDGTVIDVAITWHERLDGQVPADSPPFATPRILIYTHSDGKVSSVDLSPDQARSLAEAMSAVRSGHLAGALSGALAGDCDWLTNTLAAAAELLTPPSTEVPA